VKDGPAAFRFVHVYQTFLSSGHQVIAAQVQVQVQALSRASRLSARLGLLAYTSNIDVSLGNNAGSLVCTYCTDLISSLNVPGLGEPQSRDPHRSRNRSLADADQRVIRS
jgi:hypothetical protein